MRVLFLFLDGVGLGEDDPEINPFARAETPTLQGLLGGQKMLRSALPEPRNGSPALVEARYASLAALDASLGVAGLPQSATGQAVLLTGVNIPQQLGYHWGPKPNQEVAAYLRSGSLFSHAQNSGRRSALLNAYPKGYFDAIHSGRRIYSAIPLAVTSAGISLKDETDYYTGRAISADFTGQGWREHLGYNDAPLFSPKQAGAELGRLAAGYYFSLFEFWLSDYAGHKQDMDQALEVVETLDKVLGGLVETWDMDAGLILVTSDHGNLEDLSTRRHTGNPVPGLVIGAPQLRQEFLQGVHDLTGIAPAIRKVTGF